MRKLLVRIFLMFLVGSAGLVFAQISASSNTKSPNAHALHKKLRRQMRQIAADLKAGKITEAQAKTERQNLMAVHQQEVQLKKQNGNHELTDSQAKQLNSKLDTNSAKN